MKKIDPFSITLDMFMECGEQDRSAIKMEAASRCEESVKRHFQNHPDVFWIAIAGKEDTIIAEGTRENEPDSSDIEKMSREINLIVFVFYRCPIIEEICCSL